MPSFVDSDKCDGSRTLEHRADMSGYRNATSPVRVAKVRARMGPAFCDRNDKRLGALDKQPACFETRSVERSSA